MGHYPEHWVATAVQYLVIGWLMACLWVVLGHHNESDQPEEHWNVRDRLKALVNKQSGRRR